MCISTVPRPNRSECFPFNNTNFTVPLMGGYVGWSLVDTNCSHNESTSTSIIIKELDTLNNIHSVEVNFTIGDMSELDVSQFDFPNTIWLVHPSWEVAVKSSAFVPVMLGGVIGNMVLLSVLARTRTLRTPTNLLIANMALTDMVTLLLGPWMLLVHHFFQNYVLGAVGCKLEGFLSGSLLITGVMNLTAVSYDRLTAIVLPQEARMSRRATIIVMGMTWFIGVVFAMPLCIWRTYKERQWKNFLETYCSENSDVLPLYWHVLLSTLVWVPITIMTICYSAIFFKLDRYEQCILRREHPLAVSYKTRVARTLFVVLVTFIVCRVPFTVLVFWRNKILKDVQINSVDGSFQVLWFFAHYLIYLNCAINPLIYGLTNENYRRAFGLTCLYKWIGGKTKNIKFPEKEQKQKVSLEMKPEERPRGCYGWCGGSVRTPSPRCVASTKTSPLPLPQDYI